jgi:hypothetical protein
MDEIIKALSIGAELARQNNHLETQKTLLELRSKIFEGTPTVWSNRKSFRRYQNQEKIRSTGRNIGFKKYKVIMIDEN